MKRRKKTEEKEEPEKQEEKQDEKKERGKKDGKKRPGARFIDFIAFVAMTAAAVLYVVGPIIRWVSDTGSVFQILNAVAQLFLFAAISIPAWWFVRNKRKGWKIFYFSVLVVYIVGTVFGVTFGIL